MMLSNEQEQILRQHKIQTPQKKTLQKLALSSKFDTSDFEIVITNSKQHGINRRITEESSDCSPSPLFPPLTSPKNKKFQLRKKPTTQILAEFAELSEQNNGSIEQKINSDQRFVDAINETLPRKQSLRLTSTVMKQTSSTIKKQIIQDGLRTKQPSKIKIQAPIHVTAFPFKIPEVQAFTFRQHRYSNTNQEVTLQKLIQNPPISQNPTHFQANLSPFKIHRMTFVPEKILKHKGDFKPRIPILKETLQKQRYLSPDILAHGRPMPLLSQRPTITVQYISEQIGTQVERPKSKNSQFEGFNIQTSGITTSNYQTDALEYCIQEQTEEFPVLSRAPTRVDFLLQKQNFSTNVEQRYLNPLKTRQESKKNRQKSSYNSGLSLNVKTIQVEDYPESMLSIQASPGYKSPVAELAEQIQFSKMRSKQSTKNNLLNLGGSNIDNFEQMILERDQSFMNKKKPVVRKRSMKIDLSALVSQQNQINFRQSRGSMINEEVQPFTRFSRSEISFTGESLVSSNDSLVDSDDVK